MKKNHRTNTGREEEEEERQERIQMNREVFGDRGIITIAKRIKADTYNSCHVNKKNRPCQRFVDV